MSEQQHLGATRTQAELTFWARVGKEPSFAAFWLLRVGFVALPILMGLDKFFNLMTDWTYYLAPVVTDVLPVSAQTFMYGVGVIEIVAGLAVAAKPRYAAYVVALWLAGIITNLLILGGYYDVALRDFGLLVAALALALLARQYDLPKAKLS